MATTPRATSPGCPGCRGSAWGLLLPLPQTPSLFCAFIPYSCDHLGAMPPLSFPDSAGISGSSPLHLPLQKAPGLRAALPPVFVRLSLPPRSLFPPLPAKVLPSQLSLVFIFSWLRRAVTSDSPLLLLRGSGKTRPTFAWCQLHSPGLLLLPGGGGSCYRTVSPPFSSQLDCSWRDWSAQSWGPPRSCSMELASPSLPPALAASRSDSLTSPPFPLLSVVRKASSLQGWRWRRGCSLCGWMGDSRQFWGAHAKARVSRGPLAKACWF